jgi:hypothetical protein
MIIGKSPGAVAAHGASKSDPLGGKVFSKANSQHPFAQAPICAELIVSDRREAEGFIARGHAPALELCRELVAAGFGPAFPLEAWRGGTLCLRVHSIGEGARLTVAVDRHGTPRLRRHQERAPGYVGASTVAQIAKGRDIIASPAQQATWEPAP